MTDWAKLASKAVLRDINYPPAGHSFLIPEEALRDPERWIRDNCLLVTRAHYEELTAKAAVAAE